MKRSKRSTSVCGCHGDAGVMTKWGWTTLVSLVVVVAGRTQIDADEKLAAVVPLEYFGENRSSIPQTVYTIGFMPALTENKGRSKHFVGALKYGLIVSFACIFAFRLRSAQLKDLN